MRKHIKSITTPITLLFNVGLICFLPQYGQAQRFVNYSTPHGLAAEGVNDVLVDDRGTIWFATENGVSRFDGNWTNFRVGQGTSRLVHNSVRTIARDRGGKLWFGTRGGVSRIDPASDLDDPENWENFTNTNTDFGLANDDVTSIIFAWDLNNSIWFGTNGSGISIFTPVIIFDPPPGEGELVECCNGSDENKYWKTLTRDDGLRSNTIFDMEVDGQNNVWIATANGMNIYESANDSLIVFPQNNTFIDIGTIYRDRIANIWLGGFGSGLFRIAPNNLSHFDANYTRTNGLASNTVIAISEDREGNIWLGHGDNGVSTAPLENELSLPENWRTFSLRDGLASIVTNAIAEDMEGNLWFGHFENGTTQLDRSWLSFVNQSNAEANFINKVYHNEQQNTLWVATDGGVLRIDPKSNLLLENNTIDTLTTTNAPLASNRVFAVFQDNRSFLWLGTQKGINRVNVASLSDPDAWQTFRFPAPLIWDLVTDITEDDQGYIWIATNEGVNRVHVDSTAFAQSWETVTTIDGLASNGVLDILVDSREQVWFATQIGISRLALSRAPHNPANWTFYDIRDGLAGRTVFSIFEDEKGHLWFSTSGGVSRIDPQQSPLVWQNFSTSDGLASNFVGATAQFGQNEFWFATAAGASQFSQSDDRDFWTTFTTLSSGLQNNFVTSVLAIERELWFGTRGGGLARHQPQDKPPQITIDNNFDIVADNSVEFHYHGADLITPAELLRYQYRLDSGEWIDTFNKSATVFLEESDKLERHVFEVRAVDLDGNFTPIPAADVFYKITTKWGGEITLTDEFGSVRLYLPPNQFGGGRQAKIARLKKFELEDSSFVLAAYDIKTVPEKDFDKTASLAITMQGNYNVMQDRMAIFRWEQGQWQ
ncbi:MAG: two-component regulator propeller domain-containing protein, partial [bacterium]